MTSLVGGQRASSAPGRGRGRVGFYALQMVQGRDLDPKWQQHTHVMHEASTEVCTCTCHHHRFVNSHQQVLL